MPFHDRRSILSGLATAGGLLALPPFALGATGAMPSVRSDPVFLVPPFQLGIASGDPVADGFVIWTRLAPEPLQPNGGMTMVPILVHWEVSGDEGFRTIVAAGDAIAHPELAHSVHVEVSGLQSDRPYWYRFRCGREQSLSGRSRTLPLPGAPKDRVRFAVAGCQHYEEGHYTAWRCIAQEPIDFVYHYGDYIYEGRETGPGPRLMNGRQFSPLRRHVGDEIYSLDDYRRRYALYKTDHDLQAAHAAAPWFVSFDDHEIDNNWAADRDQDGTPPEIFAYRRAMAMQAYYEHMPLRRSSMPVNGHMQMFRRARFGDLIDAHILDTRQYRSDQVNGDRDSPLSDDVVATHRTMLGERQEKWLFDGLSQGKARWQFIAQQVMLMMLAQRRPGASEPSYSMDGWSGYLHSRRRLLGHIADRRLANVVTVSGDAHRHFAGDLVDDRGNGAVVASEFLATSITSGSDGTGQSDAYYAAVKDNPCLKALIDLRGYLLCDVDHHCWRGDLKVLDSVMRQDGTLSTFATFVAEPGEPGLKKA